MTITTTEELRAADRAAERLSRRCFRAGWAILAVGVVGILTGWIVAGEHIETDPSARLLVSLSLLTLVGLGAALIVVGAVGCIYTPTRALVWHLNEQVQVNQQRITELVAILGEVPGKIAELEKAIESVPAYGEGVVDGIQMRTGALGPEIS